MSEIAGQAAIYTPNERQLTLLELIAGHNAVTKHDVRRLLPAYGNRSDAAFERLLERDLEQLRRAGYPIDVTGDYTYRYDRTAGLAVNVSALDISLLRSLLSGVTTRGPLYLAANNGLHKLLATSNSLQDRASYLTANIPAGEEALRLARALQYHQQVRFAYSGTSAAGVSEYLLEPGELEEHFDAYYVSGPARRLGGPKGPGRWEERRTFRATRIVAGSLAVTGPAERPQAAPGSTSFFTAEEAFVAIRPGAALPLAMRGEQVEPGIFLDDDGVRSRIPSSWQLFRFRHVDQQRLFEELAGYGLDVRLVGDGELVHQWQSRLRHLTSLGAM